MGQYLYPLLQGTLQNPKASALGQSPAPRRAYSTLKPPQRVLKGTLPAYERPFLSLDPVLGE